MDELTIKSKIKNFKVFFSTNFRFIDELLLIPSSVVVVGKVVHRLYKEKIFDKFAKDKLIILSLEEENKTLDTVLSIYDKLLTLASKKNLTIISFGGGVNQDVVGFVASTLYRGIKWIFVPTTLLAQADSAIGLKTSLNYKSYKNVIGTFYPPDKIFINPKFLHTLEKKDYASGVGEIVKLFLMEKDSIKKLDKIATTVSQLISSECEDDFLMAVIKDCSKIKLSYMEGDEFDKGRRNLLNYGHDLGHSLETASNFIIPHGIAVVIGMIFANLVSVRKGWLLESTNDFINKNLFMPNIQRNIIRLRKKYFEKELLLAGLKKDKKRQGEALVLILPKKNLELTKILNYTPAEFGIDLKRLVNILNPIL